VHASAQFLPRKVNTILRKNLKKTDKGLDCPPNQSVNVTDRNANISLYFMYKDGDWRNGRSEQPNSLPEMNKAALNALWRQNFGTPPPEQTRRDLLQARVRKIWLGQTQPRAALHA
jgi:hypothetical protein